MYVRMSQREVSGNEGWIVGTRRDALSVESVQDSLRVQGEENMQKAGYIHMTW